MPELITDATVLVDSVDLSRNVKGVTVQMDRTPVDKTPVGSAGRRYVGGLTDGEFVVLFHQDSTVDQTIRPLLASPGFPVRISTPTATGWEMLTAIVYGYTPIRGSTGDVSMVSVEFGGIIIDLGHMVTGVRAVANAVGRPGAVPILPVTVIGARASATATGKPGVKAVTVTGNKASATATGQAGFTQIGDSVVGVRAVATATALPGSLAGIRVMGVRATSTATAQPGIPLVSGPGGSNVVVVGVRATATATGKPGFAPVANDPTAASNWWTQFHPDPVTGEGVRVGMEVGQASRLLYSNATYPGLNSFKIVVTTASVTAEDSAGNPGGALPPSAYIQRWPDPVTGPGWSLQDFDSTAQWDIKGLSAKVSGDQTLTLGGSLLCDRSVASWPASGSIEVGNWPDNIRERQITYTSRAGSTLSGLGGDVGFVPTGASVIFHIPVKRRNMRFGSAANLDWVPKVSRVASTVDLNNLPGSVCAELTTGTGNAGIRIRCFYNGSYGNQVEIIYVVPAGVLGTFTVPISGGAAAVFTMNAHGLVRDDAVTFTTTGALPTGLAVGTRYYVVGGGLTVNTFEVSKTLGGPAVKTTGTQSGVHTARRDLTVSMVNNPAWTPTPGRIVTVSTATNGAGTSTSTSQDVIDAINAHPDAETIITAERATGNATGLGIVTALAQTPLAGGDDGDLVMADSGWDTSGILSIGSSWGMEWNVTGSHPPVGSTLRKVRFPWIDNRGNDPSHNQTGGSQATRSGRAATINVGTGIPCFSVFPYPSSRDEHGTQNPLRYVNHDDRNLWFVGVAAHPGFSFAGCKGTMARVWQMFSSWGDYMKATGAQATGITSASHDLDLNGLICGLHPLQYLGPDQLHVDLLQTEVSQRMTLTDCFFPAFASAIFSDDNVTGECEDVVFVRPVAICAYSAGGGASDLVQIKSSDRTGVKDGWFWKYIFVTLGGNTKPYSIQGGIHPSRSPVETNNHWDTGELIV